VVWLIFVVIQNGTKAIFRVFFVLVFWRRTTSRFCVGLGLGVGAFTVSFATS
jgi:hypothetical protein